MKSVTGWWFGREDRTLGYDDGRPIVLGETHKVEGEIIPCIRGLHLSKRIIDALNYAPGPVVYRVNGSGVIKPHGDPVDKYACSERTYLAGGIDISDILRLFARQCALDVIHLWEAPEIVRRYLETGDESIRDAARAVARAVACPASRAGKSAAARVAGGAAWAAAAGEDWGEDGDSLIGAVKGALWAAVWAVVRATTGGLLAEAEVDAEASDKQNRRLNAMVNEAITAGG